MSSGGKGGRSSKGSRGTTDRNSGGGATHNHQSKPDHNHNDKDSILHKIAPTAEQLRIAQMIDNTHSEPEKVLQEKINQVMQVTGVSTDDAIVALHDCDNDVTAAIDALLEGEDQGEWRESTKKKKKSPASKTKEEVESNKENRRVENRERSTSKPRGGSGAPPRFRGRGGGRGGREESGEGYSRGVGSRRGKMSNGTAPASRGRGTRGRGSSALNSRTFQKRQPSSFTETIDTWGATPTEKVENSTNDLQIDNWDEETSGTTEDWDGEWTGSLDTTTVFRPSSGPGVGVPVRDVQDISPIISNTVPTHSSSLASAGSVIGSSCSLDTSQSSRATHSLDLQQNISESVNNVLSLGQSQLSNSSMNASQSFSSVVPSSGSQAIDLAALLQKAAPHSTVGRLPPQIVDSATLGSTALGGDTKNMLSGLAASVGDSLKVGVQINNRGSSITSPGPQSYAPSAASISNSMYSNSVSSLGSSLASGNDVNKVLGLSSQNPTLTSRSKPPSRRLPQASSKIPSSAVEMPEVAMAALDMQFTGLEFGTESFDFTSDVKPVMGNSLVSGSMGGTRDSSVIVPSVTKDLNSLNSNLPQQQPLGPQPIPFPTHANERKPPSASLLSNTQRSSCAGPTSAATSQNSSDLTNNDCPPGGGQLGSMMGSSSSSHSAYQSASVASYGSKSASSFPSPPTAHYAQTTSQNYSNNSSSGVGNTTYGGNSVNSNNGSSNNSNGNQSSGGYGSGYAVQASVTSGQYQNNYVNASSHSLASISVPKTQTLTGLKDPSQNYNDSSVSASSLSNSLSTNATVGVSNSGTGGLSSMNSVTSSSIQSSKPSVPGKIVNNMGSSVPPNVQQHSVTQSQQQQHHIAQQQLNQHHQTHHHLQQQQQVAQQAQQTQMLAGPGPSQYVSPQAAALQGTLPPAFYNVQQPAMYSYEDLQLFQRIPHMPQAPTTLAGGRDGTITSPGSYSVADAAKFRTDQNSSPVPSTINQQGAAAGTYITATQNAAIPPFYMYQTMPAVPSNFTQYGTPAIIQIPPNTHTGSNTSQFPGPPKLPYGQGNSTYYDTMSQTQDYKASYGSGSQAQNKAGPNSSGSASNSGSDLTGYKNHLGKFDKQGFHTGNPPAFNMAGSGTNPMAANYTQMFIPTMPAAAQHHSTMMHHQLHQVRSNQMDGGSSAAQRTGSAGGQSKGGSKGGYTGSYWGTN